MPKKKRSRKLLIGSLITLVVLSLIAAGLVYIPRLGWEASPYGYDIVERAMKDSDSSWSITLPLFAGEDSTSTSTRNPWEKKVEVYGDPELNYPIKHVTTHQSTRLPGVHTVVLEPSQGELNPWFALPESMDSPHVGAAGLWPSGTYYVAEKYSLLGGLLKRPRVHIFTVEPHGGALAAPEFTMEMSPYGVPLFSWSVVEDASAYYVVRQPPQALTKDETHMDIIGVVDGNTSQWYASTQDLDYQNGYQNGEAVSVYNSAFVAFDSQRGVQCQPQDVFYQGDDPPDHDTSTLAYPSFSVVAVDGEGNTSFVSYLDGKELVMSTVGSIAGKTFERMRHQSSKPETFLPAQLPVTMGDCRTVFLDTEARTLVSHPDKKDIALTYGAQGTLLSVVIDTDQGGSYTTIKSMGEKKGLAPIYQREFGQDLVMMSPRQTRDYAQGKEISYTIPDSPYTWVGTSEMVTYIAANMFAGTEAIDMTRFITPDAPLIIDAANEAYVQNPYIIDMFPIVGVINNVLYVDYEITAEERAKSAEKIHNKVMDVAQSLFTESMTERERALAINEYLSKTASYDKGAYDFSSEKRTREDYVKKFPHSWNATGVLLEGKGVCTSYAGAFHLLAQEAQLETMIITGYADDSGLGHAWVKVKLGKQWRIIDPTWNSNIWEQSRGNINRYFALTDREGGRTEFSAFVVDRYIPDYQAT